MEAASWTRNIRIPIPVECRSFTEEKIHYRAKDTSVVANSDGCIVRFSTREVDADPLTPAEGRNVIGPSRELHEEQIFAENSIFVSADRTCKM